MDSRPSSHLWRPHHRSLSPAVDSGSSSGWLRSNPALPSAQNMEDQSCWEVQWDLKKIQKYKYSNYIIQMIKWWFIDSELIMHHPLSESMEIEDAFTSDALFQRHWGTFGIFVAVRIRMFDWFWYKRHCLTKTLHLLVLESFRFMYGKTMIYLWLLDEHQRIKNQQQLFLFG